MSRARDLVTIVKSTNPSQVCKTFELRDGQLTKKAIANVVEGVASTYEVKTAEDMATLLRKVTARKDAVICPGIWKNAQVGEQFRFVSEKQLAMMFGSEVGKVEGGVLINSSNEKVAARLKRGISLSSWLLLDADNPPGMPDEWAAMDIQQRLELLEKIVPGISKVERVELRGSSHRVSNDGHFGGASHAWIRVSDPAKIPILKAHIRVLMVLHGVAFAYKKLSRKTGLPVGVEDRTVFDLSVFDAGRLVFCSEPDVSAAPGYSVADADVRVVNSGGGVLDISDYTLPTEAENKALETATGVRLDMKIESVNGSDEIKLSTKETGMLTMDTEIEAKGVVLPLREWVDGKSPGYRMRCEAPFRVSHSEAAFIKVGDNGVPFVHDVGNTTTYMISQMAVAEDFDDLDTAANDESHSVSPKPTAVTQASSNSVGTIRPNIAAQVSSDRPFNWDEWAFLKARGVFRNVETGEECKKDAFNTAYHRNVPRVPTSNGGFSQPLPATYLMRTLRGQVAHDILYWPAAAVNGGRFFSFSGIRYVNSYMPDQVPKADPNWQSHPAWQIVLAHFKRILPNDWNMLLQWLAHNVQHPGVKILWALVIKGVEGDGKTTIYKLLGHVMGSVNVREVSTQELNSEFNAWAEGSCVVALEEVRIKGHNRYDTMNKLKPAIANTTISVVRKGQDGRNVPNCSNYLAFTNETDALALTENDRRYGVLFTKYQTREQLEAETDKAYWDQLHDAYQQHPGVIRGWLESIDLSNFDRNAAPKMTEAKRQMIRNAKSEDFLVVEEAIALGGFGVSPDVVCTGCLNNLIRENGHYKVRTSALSRVLKEMGYERHEATVKWNGKNRRLYYRPKAVDVRRDVEAVNADFRAILDDTGEHFDAEE